MGNSQFSSIYYNFRPQADEVVDANDDDDDKESDDDNNQILNFKLLAQCL
jgi:hypothetical protein